jgi:hypothetical protein
MLAGRKPKASMSKLPWMLLLLRDDNRHSGSAEGFTAYTCSNRSNVVELYSLLEPDACATSDGRGRSRLWYTGRSYKSSKIESYPYSDAR